MNRIERTVIIIGNGFDMGCDLPTSYPNFLEFIALVEDACTPLLTGKIYTIENTGIKNIESIKRLISEKINTEESKEKWRELLTNTNYIINRYSNTGKGRKFCPNVWLKLFTDELLQIKSNVNICNFCPTWLDFEAEISKYIQLLDIERGRKNAAIALDSMISTELISPEFYNFLKLYIRPLRIEDRYQITIRQVKEILLNDLRNLTKALELYIADYVNTLPVNPSEAIKKAVDEGLNAAESCCVISFNYTKTLENYIKKRAGINNVHFCYVHGKASGNFENEHPNIVVGIDDYKLKDQETDLCPFEEFKKYHQRIFYGTSNKYSVWLSQQVYTYTVVIGHSLGAPDKEILESFLSRHNKVNCYYYSEASHMDLISNSAYLLGKREMMQRVLYNFGDGEDFLFKKL